MLNWSKKFQGAGRIEAIRSLAGGVAHDLNNILSGLVSYPELMLLGTGAYIKKPYLIEKIGAAVHRKLSR